MIPRRVLLTSRRTGAALLSGFLLAGAAAATANAAPVAPLPVSAPAAVVGTEVSAQEIASALRDTGYYIEPGYVGMTADAAQELASRSQAASTPIYLALVTDGTSAAAGGRNALLAEVRSATALPGTYVVADSQGFQAASDQVRVSELSRQAAAGAQGAQGVLTKLVELIDARASSPSGTTSTSQPSSSGFPWALVGILGLIGGGTAYAVRNSRARRRREQAAQLEAGKAVRRVLEEDITVIGEQIAVVDPADPRLGEVGRGHLAGALAAYQQARDSGDRVTVPEETQAVTAALDDARYNVSAVQALLAGKAVPPRRPACLFDPRHGSSERDVLWTPPPAYAMAAPPQPRSVPACQECARAVDLGGQPAARLVPAGNGMAPYWDAGGQYAPYARGYYASYGSNMLSSVLVGTMLASMWAPGWGYPMGGGCPFPDSAGTDFGGGDFGGGSFGGGDFGGGDFGGF